MGAPDHGVTVEGSQATLPHATAHRNIPAGLVVLTAAPEVLVAGVAILGAG